MKKTELIEEIIKKLTEELEAVTRAARAAHEAATHEESKAEDPHDTRGLEASYLAGAQLGRAAEIQALIGAYRALSPREFKPGEPIGIGALVEIDQDGRRSRFFIGPRGGGLALEIGGKRIHVITPSSPLGEALIGRRAGEAFEIEAQGARGSDAAREYEVVSVA